MSKAPLTRQSYPLDKQENNFVFAGIFRPSPFATSLTRDLLISSNDTSNSLYRAIYAACL